MLDLALFLTILLGVAKVAGVLAISWFVVFIPILALITFGAVVLSCGLLVTLAAAVIERM